MPIYYRHTRLVNINPKKQPDARKEEGRRDSGLGEFPERRSAPGGPKEKNPSRKGGNA
jgi:hypothetical protein